MTRILKNLRIDEVSCVIRGANPGSRVLIRKAADDDAPRAKSFNEVMKESDPRRTKQIEDDKKLSDKLKEMVAVMVVAYPTRSEEEHLFSLLHSARGRRLAEHLNNLTKRDSPMPQVNIFKLYNPDSVVEIAKAINTGESEISPHIFNAIVMGHAALAKRGKESNHQAFARIVDDNIEIRRALLKSDVPNLMSVEPVSVEVGSTLVSDDSQKAYRQLQELAEKQHRTFEQVFSDPANGELAGRTYTSAHRPNVSSPSGDALQR